MCRRTAAVQCMASFPQHLSEFVLPDAPLRQWVLTVPHALRPRVGYDRRLLPRIYGIFYESIQRFYERRLADLGHSGGRTGSVTAIQRASSDLRLNPHLHGVFLSGPSFPSQRGAGLSRACRPRFSKRDRLRG